MADQLKIIERTKRQQAVIDERQAQLLEAMKTNKATIMTVEQIKADIASGRAQIHASGLAQQVETYKKANVDYLNDMLNKSFEGLKDDPRTVNLDELDIEELKAAGYTIPENATDDPVNHPKHYTSHPSGVECIQVTEHMNFNLGNAVKYIWRTDSKGDPIQNLEKARWYLDREIARRSKV